MNITLLLDSVDYSSYLPKYGYTVAYKKVLGANSCYTLDGTYHEDVLAYKAVITTELKPMTSVQLSAIIEACKNCENATYFDTRTNAIVTKNVIATLSAAAIVLNTSESVIWNQDTSSGIILTIEER
jgi:hypothetical protein